VAASFRPASRLAAAVLRRPLGALACSVTSLRHRNWGNLGRNLMRGYHKGCGLRVVGGGLTPKLVGVSRRWDAHPSTVGPSTVARGGVVGRCQREVEEKEKGATGAWLPDRKSREMLPSLPSLSKLGRLVELEFDPCRLLSLLSGWCCCF
jgi:hypothetical protein